MPRGLRFSARRSSICFASATDRIELSASANEFHLVPRRTAPLDFEVHSVEVVHGHSRGAPLCQAFRPLYQTLNSDAGNYGRYFSLRREPRVTSSQIRRHGARTSHAGTEVYVSLVDQHEAPFSESLRFISADAWLTNRDLPLLVPRDGVDDLDADDRAPVANVGFAHAPSPPGSPFAEREAPWRLIRQINLNHLPLEDVDHRQGGAALRDLLRLFSDSGNLVQQSQIQSLVGLKANSISMKLPRKGPLVFARGIEYMLTVDEHGFSGLSPYLFGLILEQYLIRHAAINTFTQTELRSMQRGRVMHWPARIACHGARR